MGGTDEARASPLRPVQYVFCLTGTQGLCSLWQSSQNCCLFQGRWMLCCNVVWMADSLPSAIWEWYINNPNTFISEHMLRVAEGQKPNFLSVLSFQIHLPFFLKLFFSCLLTLSTFTQLSKIVLSSPDYIREHTKRCVTSHSTLFFFLIIY